ncbi:hypothetical protein FEK35_23985 [Nocardia cyriacigeorgica]|uniref:NACHT domain-containing protein n=1 Tax=Nocardia cyriacigeorgica TaxID=135487 RepID=A0A5R8PA99_9NOCA|nr:hypothetical protein [Nocardia cyriacigeorgica]TLG00308.1 hypothetical protein FEK35_23985 [Nocardia cyriacigeorgica]
MGGQAAREGRGRAGMAGRLDRLNPALGESAMVFSHLTQVLCGDLATDVTRSAVEGVRYFADNYDGGAEAVAKTVKGRVVAVQAKAYSDFRKEVLSIRKSVQKLLVTAAHEQVTDYVWCSTFDMTVADRGDTIRDALKGLERIAKTHGRDIRFHFKSIGELRGLMQAEKAGLYMLYFGSHVISGDDIAILTSSSVRDSLDRVIDPANVGLHFESDLEHVLHTYSTASTDDQVEAERLTTLTDEFARRLGSVRTEDMSSVAPEGIGERVLLALKTVAGKTWAELGDDAEFADVPGILDLIVGNMNNEVQAIISAHRASGAHALDVLKRQAIDRFCEIADSAVAIESEWQRLDAIAKSVSTRMLVVSGRWGTGKTYHLARHIQTLNTAGTSTLFVRARNFDRPDTSILAQSWRDSLPARDAGIYEFMTVIDCLGKCSRRPFILAIDGLNEWAAVGNPRDHLELLAELLAEFPNVRVIVTSRRSDSPHTPGPWGEYWHHGPERAVMGKQLSRALNIPAVTHWGRALTNPLTARIAAAVFGDTRERGKSALPTPLMVPFSFPDLVQRWIALLATEYTRRNPGSSAALVTDIVSAVAAAGGHSTRPQVANSVAATRPAVDNVVDYLIDGGVLEDADLDTNVIRFRWQRVHEIARIRHLIQRGQDAVLADLPPSSCAPERADYLSVLTEQLPHTVPSAELPRWLAGRLDTDELMDVFSRSLQSRDPATYSPVTVELARTALTDPDTGAYVCFAALTNIEVGSGAVSPGWLADALHALPGKTRESVWPRILDECLIRTDDIEVVSGLYTWLAVMPRSALPDAHRTGVARMLLWWSWRLVDNSAREFAARWLCEELNDNPELIDTLLDDCATTRDEHLIEMTAAAATGVILRWPTSPSSHHVAGAVTVALDRLRPQMYRTLTYAYLLATHGKSEASDFPAYLRSRERPPRTAFRIPVSAEPSGLAALRSGDYGMFDDEKPHHKNRALELVLWGDVGIDWRKRRAIARIPTPIGATMITNAVARHADVVRERWLLHQCARYRFGHVVWRNGRYIKAGSPGNPAVSYTTPRENAFATERNIDPTVPLSMDVWKHDSNHRHWWVTPPTINTVGDLIVTDDEGIEWIVLDAVFDWVEPVYDQPPQYIWLAQALSTLGGPRAREDGMPHPGQRFSRALTIDTEISALDGRPGMSERKSSTLFMASRLRDSTVDDGDQPWKALSFEISTQHQEPDRRLAALLNATWTGDHLDYRDADERLAITDPSLGADGPRAVLVRWDSLIAGLNATGRIAHVSIKIIDRKTGRSRYRTLAIDGTGEHSTRASRWKNGP